MLVTSLIFFFILQSIHACYGAYAYIYHTNTTVYNVSLYDTATATVTSPVVSQSSYVLPPGKH
ncbi:hypothetical protein EON63_11770 [archaeon]|nr:MAG: hypothetical protein EON63_11770 [archaeon]